MLAGWMEFLLPMTCLLSLLVTHPSLEPLHSLPDCAPSAHLALVQLCGQPELSLRNITLLYVPAAPEQLWVKMKYGAHGLPLT